MRLYVRTRYGKKRSGVQRPKRQNSAQQQSLSRLIGSSHSLGKRGKVVRGDDAVDVEERFDLPFDLGHAEQI